MKLLLPLLCCGLLAACGASNSNGELKGARADGDGKRDDGARCEYKGMLDREVAESVGTGSVQPSIRRVFRLVGEGEQKRRVLFCREVDTNLDGIKDLVRQYNERGEPAEEQADSNYDGKIETWVRFAKGRIAQVEIDNDGDGKPDETRYYLQGHLSRVQRDTNKDGKPDVWEIYQAGRLERMGVDLDYDGRVDRWNRDQIARREAEKREREADAAQGQEAEGGQAASGDAKDAQQQQPQQP
jgi:hypothetical protein